MTNKDEVSLARQFSGFLNTPALWEDGSAPFQQFRVHKVDLPEDLDLDIPKKLPLGRRVEHFFAYYIEQYSNKELLAANVQISSNKITIGELDFLLRDRSTGKVTHVELVYKFYIFDPESSSEAGSWIGPNRKDSLLRKMNHLSSRQFPLLYQQETREYLKELKLEPEDIEQRVCFKANLFLPKDYKASTFQGINQNCITGYWIKKEDFLEENYGDSGFYTPKKADWPGDPAAHQNWRSFSEIKDQLQELFIQQKAPLVWRKKPLGGYEKFFIVWW
jgi:uncharacterized protein